VRDRRGARLEFHLLVHSTEPLRIAIATAVGRDLERVGMHAEVRVLDPQEIAQRLTSHTFEAFMGRWYPNLGLELDPVWRSESTDRQNFGGYSNARVDSLLGRLRHDLHPDERATAMARLQATVYADQPYLFLVQEPRLLLLSRRVRGARPQVGAPFWNLPEWWIPRRLQDVSGPAS
jgi:peptide/nickel transport system substrate-binding protein